MGFQNVSDRLRDSFPERDINRRQCMVRTIRQTQEFGPIPASNDEKVSVPVVLLLGAQISLPCGLCAAVLCAKLEKPVRFETLQEFTNVAFDNVAANTKFAADFLDHLGFGPTALQHFKDFGAHKIEGEHLSVMDVKNDSPVAVVSAAHSFGYLQQGVPLFPVIPIRTSLGIGICEAQCHERLLASTSA
jgi:hypothetical protein